MNKTVFRGFEAWAVLALVGAVTGWAAPPTVTNVPSAVAERPESRGGASVANGMETLWDQSNYDVDVAAFVDQEFGDYPTHASYLVTDVVTGAGGWTIQSVTTYFTHGDGAWDDIWLARLNIFEKTWYLPDYEDWPTAGTVVFVTLTDLGDTWAITAWGLDEHLDAYTEYWVGLTPIGNYGSVGQEFHRGAPIIGDDTAWRNPGGGFDHGTYWQDTSALGPDWVYMFDAAILIEGPELGACCRPSGYCSEMTESECDSSGWDYQGDGTDCSPNPCSGACCFEDGECQVTNTPEQCYLAGGVSWRVGQDCTPSPCTGACCLLDGSCVPDIDVDACQAMDSHGWVFAGGCDECPPPPEDGDLCGFQIWIGSDADPVNTATGNFHHAETDFSIASRGRPLVLQRFYNSLNPDAGMLGPGWMHSYGSVLYPEAGEDEVAIRWADGRIDRWTDVGGGTYEPAQWDCYDELVYDAGTWTVTKTNLDVYEFDADGKLTSITDKNANAFTLAYNIDNRLEYVTDPAGRWLTLSYYPDGLLQSVADWTGRTVQYSYDANGRLEHVTDVLLNTIDYTYDPNGYLATINDQRGVAVVTNQYDPDGRVTHQWDGNGNETEFIYGRRAENETTIRRYLEDRGGQRPVDTIHAHDPDFKKQLLVENPLAERVDYGYWNFERTEIVDRNGNTTRFDYDTRGNVLSAAEADDPNDLDDGGVTTVAYDDPDFKHVPTKRIDALGAVTDWGYDAKGNVEHEVRYLDPNQTVPVTKHWTYNNEGQRLTETNERGKVHQWVYDPNTGLLTEEIDWDHGDPNDPNDSVEMSHTWYGYDDLWRRIWATDGRGSGPEDAAYTTHYYYDNADRLIRTEGPPVGDPPHSIVQWFGYDNVGNRLWVTDGMGSGPNDPNHTTHYEYDDNGNLTSVTDAHGGQTRYEYDELSRKVKMFDANTSDPNTPTMRYTYDDADRLESMEDAEGNVWGYTYDAHGNVLTQVDPAGVTITHEYDALNRRIKTTDDLGNETRFDYDQLGRLISQIDANGNETQFNYDALGRLTCVIDAEGGWTEYTYDDAGNLTQIENANDSVISTREYDTLNRLVKAYDGNGNFYEYAYDIVGNQIWVIDAKFETTTMEYDAASRLTRIQYHDGTDVTYTYDDNGNVLTVSDPNDPNATTSFTYDALNRLLSSTDSFGKQVSYGYDAVGNRTSLTYPADAVNPERTVGYEYDAANRLTTITDWLDPNRPTQYAYACCNKIGTITYPNGVVETREYDLAGRLDTLITSDSGSNVLLSYDYDRDGLGSPTSVTETGTLEPTPEQLVTDYDYDADNRLVESSQGTYEYDANGNLISRTVDGKTTTFEYDHEDRLVSQATDPNTVEHVYDGAGSRVARIDNGAETRYVLDRGRSMSHVLCETDDTGTITAYYIQGPLLVSRIGADGSQRYYHTNSIGNVVALTDENELITDRYAYTPFGLLTKEGTTDNPFTYVGGLGVMAESDGLYFMRARFYDPDTGRFLGKDPVLGVLTEPQSLHRYVYVLNRPVVLVDASGLSCKGGWQECKSGECLEAIENLFCNVQELSEFHTRMRSFTEQWHQRMAWFAKDPQRIADFLEQFHVQVDDMMSGIRAIGDCFVVLEQCFKSHPPPLPCTDPAPTLTPDLPPDIDWELAREAVGTGALAGGTVLVVGLTAVALASNPVGWAIAAGLGIAALASWAS